MAMLTPRTIRPLTAILAGLGTFAVTGAFRVQLQDSLSPEPWLGFTLTVLTYVIPGTVVGVIVARHSVVLGSLLGALTLPVVLLLFGVAELRFVPVGMWYKPMLTWFLLGILLCPLGSLLGAWLRGSAQRKHQAQWSR
jgi:hypothetical protein